MRIRTDWWLLGLAVLGTLGSLGCEQKKTESQATMKATEQTQPSGEAAEQAEGGGTITPAGTVAGIWAQIIEEQGKLSTAIQNGQLKDVHHLAFGIRDLAAALADKASVASPGTAPRLKGLVEQVAASATNLDKTGDAGDLSGTQTEFAKLNAILDAVKATAKPE